MAALDLNSSEKKDIPDMQSTDKQDQIVSGDILPTTHDQSKPLTDQPIYTTVPSSCCTTKPTLQARFGKRSLACLNISLTATGHSFQSSPDQLSNAGRLSVSAETFPPKDVNSMVPSLAAPSPYSGELHGHQSCSGEQHDTASGLRDDTNCFGETHGECKHSEEIPTNSQIEKSSSEAIYSTRVYGSPSCSEETAYKSSFFREVHDNPFISGYRLGDPNISGGIRNNLLQYGETYEKIFNYWKSLCPPSANNTTRDHLTWTQSAGISTAICKDSDRSANSPISFENKNGLHQTEVTWQPGRCHTFDTPADNSLLSPLKLSSSKENETLPEVQTLTKCSNDQLMNIALRKPLEHLAQMIQHIVVSKFLRTMKQHNVDIQHVVKLYDNSMCMDEIDTLLDRFMETITEKPMGAIDSSSKNVNVDSKHNTSGKTQHGNMAESKRVHKHESCQESDNGELRFSKYLKLSEQKDVERVKGNGEQTVNEQSKDDQIHNMSTKIKQEIENSSFVENNTNHSTTDKTWTGSRSSTTRFLQTDKDKTNIDGPSSSQTLWPPTNDASCSNTDPDKPVPDEPTSSNEPTSSKTEESTPEIHQADMSGSFSGSATDDREWEEDECGRPRHRRSVSVDGDLGESPSVRDDSDNLHMSQDGVTISLLRSSMWRAFAEVGTEMVINRSGRRMFPFVTVQLRGLDEQEIYAVEMEVVPADSRRYKFLNNSWTAVGVADCPTVNPPYPHPESPNSGKHWMSRDIHFTRVKLTNNKESSEGNMLLHSMHKYLVQITLRQVHDMYSERIVRSFRFRLELTSFIAVTAYQNDLVTKLKIHNNPFAKAFRDSTLTLNNKRATRKRQYSFNYTKEPGVADAPHTGLWSLQEEEEEGVGHNDLSATCIQPVDLATNPTVPRLTPFFAAGRPGHARMTLPQTSPMMWIHGVPSPWMGFGQGMIHPCFYTPPRSDARPGWDTRPMS